MNNLANELMDIADKAEAGDKLHWAKAMRAGALQLENWRRDLDRLNMELQKRDKCSYMGPMRDCPTHGDKDAKRLRWLLEHWWFGNDSGVDFGSALTEDEVRATIDAAMLKTQNDPNSVAARGPIAGGPLE